MEDVPVLSVDEEIETATKTLAEKFFDDDIYLISVKPPDQSDGMDAGPEFLKSVHLLEQQKRFLRKNRNKSPTCGLEMWYDNNKVKFMFYTPSKEIEQEYRQQLRGYYDQCEIARQTPNEGMFIRANTDQPEAIAVTQFQLKQHYYSPPASPVSEENELDSDPYQRIINEIDTKDDTRVMLQVLYKPAPYGWTDGQYMNLETFADRTQQKGGVKTRWFGMKIDEVDEPGIYESAASEMRSRINEPAYFVNIRLAIICSGESDEAAKRKAKSRAKAVSNTIEHLYETRSEQRLVPKKFSVNKERNMRELIVNMVERNAMYMSQPKRMHKFLWHKLTPRSDVIILTAGELSGFVHLPSSDELTTDSIEWTDEVVDGSVPPEVDDFEPTPKEERVGFDEDEIPEVDTDNAEDANDGTTNNNSDDDNPSTLFGGD